MIPYRDDRTGLRDYRPAVAHIPESPRFTEGWGYLTIGLVFGFAIGAVMGIALMGWR